MKMNKRGVQPQTIRAVGSCLLAAVMSMSVCGSPIYAQESYGSDASDVEKTETVYATIKDDGTVGQTIVSSWLHDGNGIHNVQEDLQLTNVKNIKTNEKPRKEGNTYTWNTNSEDIYYQGDSTKALPVQVAIRYSMDGQSYTADQMKGKSGHMKIDVQFTNTISETTSSGVVVHPAYLAGGILRLENGNYSNVTCSSGKIMNDGSNQILAFASIPGLADTLNSAGLQAVSEKVQASDTCTIEADVKDFDADNFMIGISSDFDLNELVQTGSIPDLSGQVDLMVQASNQLEEGAQELSAGTSQLIEQTQPLTSAGGSVRQLAQAFIELNGGTQTMASGIKDYTDGAGLLAEGTMQLSAITNGIEQVQSGVSGAGQTNLLEGATQLNEGLKQLKEQTDQLDENQLVDLQSKIGQAKNALQGMQTTLTKDKETLNALSSSLEEAESTLSALANDNTLNTQIASLAKDVKALNETIESNNQTIQGKNEELQQKVDAINAQIDQINAQMDASVNQTNANIQSAYNQAISGLDAAAAATEDESAKQSIASAKASLGSAPQVTSPTHLSHISSTDVSTLKQLDASSVVQDAQAIQTTLSNASKSLSDMKGQLSSAQTAMNGLNSDLQTSMTQLDAMSQMISDVNVDTDFTALITRLKQASNQLYAGSDQLLGGVQQVSAGLDQLQKASSEGIQEVQSGSKKLVSNNDTLNAGAYALENGTKQLADQSATVNSMADGLDQLGSAFAQLNDGAMQLASGQSQFNAQAMQPLKEMADLSEAEVAKLSEVFNQIEELTQEHDTFAGKPEGAKSKVNYVLHTEG